MSDNSRVRVSIVGVVVVALFASLFARLWFLQMGPEQRLGQPVSTLATRVIQIESPRGEILDRNGKVLAQDIAAWAVTVDRNLGKIARDRVLGQLSEVLGVKQTTLRANYDSKRQSPLMPAIVWLHISLAQQLAIREHREQFPGVNVTELTIRAYPYDGLASQLLGYVGGIDALDPKQYNQLLAKGYRTGDLVGRDGVEAAFESQLRGRPRKVTVQVDPTGKQVGAPTKIDPGTVGNNVRLTIDLKVQKAAESALAEGILTARTQQDTSIKTGFQTLKATGGAVVVLDVHDGSVLAMANFPTYPLSWWVGGISSDNYSKLSRPDAQNPLLNRVTEGQYAPGSTFKLVPSLALNQFGVVGASQSIFDPGFVKIGDRTFHNDNGVFNGPVNLQRALTVSSDVYFYNAGNDFWNIWKFTDPNRGLGIQQVANQLGFGKPTGIEVSEAPGRIPDPAWKAGFAKQLYKKKSDQQANSTWYPGDNVNAAVGQGDDLATPLQIVNAYACFANGGTLWTPHVGQMITDPATKQTVDTFTPKAQGKLTIDPFVYSQISAGFAGAVSDPKGTAYDAFRGLPIPISGKTGTAQISNKSPTSLFASYFSAKGSEYAAVAVVEEGGHGADTAAPIIRQVIEAMNGLPPTPIPRKPASTGKD